MKKRLIAYHLPQFHEIKDKYSLDKWIEDVFINKK